MQGRGGKEGVAPCMAGMAAKNTGHFGHSGQFGSLADGAEAEVRRLHPASLVARPVKSGRRSAQAQPSTYWMLGPPPAMDSTRPSWPIS